MLVVAAFALGVLLNDNTEANVLRGAPIPDMVPVASGFNTAKRW